MVNRTAQQTHHDIADITRDSVWITGVIMPDDYKVGKYAVPSSQSAKMYLNNVLLKDTGIQNIVSAVEAHANISAYIDSLIAYNPDVVELENDQKIIKAGFDIKTSFRGPAL